MDCSFYAVVHAVMDPEIESDLINDEWVCRSNKKYGLRKFVGVNSPYIAHLLQTRCSDKHKDTL
jgi:hypothetical protein